MSKPRLEDLTCPRCGHRGSFHIDVTATAFVDAHGAYVENGDYYWDAASLCTCLGCQRESRAAAFVTGDERS